MTDPLVAAARIIDREGEAVAAGIEADMIDSTRQLHAAVIAMLINSSDARGRMSDARRTTMIRNAAAALIDASRTLEKDLES